MPRTARVKRSHCIYHIMVRSIKELELFNEDEDKIKYMTIIQKYQVKYGFKVYAYCLMNNHGHLIIDSYGADISKIMHAVNFSYARYFNRKYDRYGHVFQDRFKSKVVDSERYMITLSAYIHNNPKDIPKYENNVKQYPFSSLKEYLRGTNTYGILSHSFLVNLLGFNKKYNRKLYMDLVKKSSSDDMIIEIEFINAETEYISHKKIIPRSCKPIDVIDYVSKLLKKNPKHLYSKYKHEHSKLRSLACFLMSSLCDMTQREICEIIGDISQSGVSHLSSKGLEIVLSNRGIIDNFPASYIFL